MDEESVGAQHLCDGLFSETFAFAIVEVAQRDLRVTPRVDVADLMNALDGASRCTPFLGDVFALHVCACVFEERDARRSALL